MSTGGSSKDGLRQQPQLYLILELLVAVAPLVLVASLGLPMSASLSVCGHFQKIVYKLHSVPQYLSNP